MGRSRTLPTQSPTPRTGRHGLTLVELVLCVAITAVIAGSVAIMLVSMRTASSRQGEARRWSVSGARIAIRLDAALRSSRMVLAKGPDYLVLWAAETTLNDKPELSELRRIERDPATGELRYYEAPPDLAPDAQYDLLSTDFDAVTNAEKGTARFPAQVWATDVTGWAVELDAADPLDASFVGYQLALALGETEEAVIGGVALRNR
jgi:hypothetical protein